MLCCSRPLPNVYDHYVTELGHKALSSLPEEIVDPVSKLADVLVKRLDGAITSLDVLACVIIATKVMDDCTDYTNDHWRRVAGLQSGDLVDFICLSVLSRLDWRVSPLANDYRTILEEKK